MRLLFFVLALTTFLKAQPGSIDYTFNPADLGKNLGGGVDNLYAMAVQQDGKVLIGGGFISYNGTGCSYITRVNSDGSIDSSFNANLGSGANGPVTNIVALAGGKVLVTGSFSAINGIAAGRIARLNSDGSVDSTFHSTVAANDLISGIAIQKDGKILICGDFTTYNDTVCNRIARLYPSGALDIYLDVSSGANRRVENIFQDKWKNVIVTGDFTSLQGRPCSKLGRLDSLGNFDLHYSYTNINGDISAAELQPDGKLIIAGNFTSFRGATCNNIIRLDSLGFQDSFTADVGTSSGIIDIEIQPDGKILFAGQFSTFNGNSADRIARTDADGVFDTTFIAENAATTGGIYVVKSAINQKLYVGGTFKDYLGVNQAGLVRVAMIDGSIDYTFNFGQSVNGQVRAIKVLKDGSILLGGKFTLYSGYSRQNLVKVKENGDIDLTFNSGMVIENTVFSIEEQTDGKIIVGGYAWVQTVNGTTEMFIDSSLKRLNSDGSYDSSFKKGKGPNGHVYEAKVLNNGKTIIVGSFQKYNDVSRKNVALLNSDGTLSNTFYPGVGPSLQVNCVDTLSDGSFIIGGNFTSYQGSVSSKLAKINASAAIDMSFSTGSGFSGGNVWDLVVDDSDRIIAVGDFYSYQGVSSGRIVRISSMGVYDNTFNVGTGANGKIEEIVLQKDGRMIVSGSFTSFDGHPCPHVARLLSDGSVDTSFQTGNGFDAAPYALAVAGDNKVLVGGNFLQYNGQNRTRVVRLLATCSLDTAVNILTSSLQANEQSASYRWLDCSAGLSVILGETNQSFQPITSGSYAIEISRMGCVDTSSCITFQALVTGVESLNEIITVFPNPTVDFVNIQLSDLSLGNLTLALYDFNGRLVPISFSSNAEFQQLDLRQIEAGLYFLRVSNGTKISKEVKLVKL